MFEKILVALDNSHYSDYGMETAINIAWAFKAHVTGCHVYAAKLHETRFMDMESGLPDRYQSEAILNRQRDIHESLISKGLGIISDSYLDRFEKRCRVIGAACERKNREGKNFVEIIKEGEEGGYDLAVMGGLGMGAVENSLIGGVCERVTRKIRTDMLVVKKNVPIKGKIVVAIDGSPHSYWGLMVAVSFKKTFGCEVEAVSVFDPHFHQAAFKNISGVLSEEAASVFKFKEQEKLHDEIIDRGMASLYQEYLEMAAKIAGARGAEIKTTLLAGKPFNEILKAVGAEEPSLLIMGRFGLHKVAGSDMGSTTENLLRMVPCNIFIGGRGCRPEEVIETGTDSASAVKWTEDALVMMERVPLFARKMAKKAIEGYAREQGSGEVTGNVVNQATQKLLPPFKSKAMG